MPNVMFRNDTNTRCMYCKERKKFKAHILNFFLNILKPWKKSDLDILILFSCLLTDNGCNSKSKVNILMQTSARLFCIANFRAVRFSNLSLRSLNPEDLRLKFAPVVVRPRRLLFIPKRAFTLQNRVTGHFFPKDRYFFPKQSNFP